VLNYIAYMVVCQLKSLKTPGLADIDKLIHIVSKKVFDIDLFSTFRYGFSKY
jgi:hypothetical protein